MIVREFDLPPDEVDSFDEPLKGQGDVGDCECAGVSTCAHCHKHTHRRTRRLCRTCWHIINRAGRLHEFPMMRVQGRKVYDAWIKMKQAEPELTQREAADRFGLNLIQLKNILTRQRRKRCVRKQGGQYRDWAG